MVILCYHKIHNAENFDRQLKYLTSRYNVISLSEFQTIIDSNKPLPANAAMITFDDGDRSLLTAAMPVLKKNNCAAVSFVISELINSDKPFWWDEIMYYTNDYSKVRAAKLMPDEKMQEYLAGLRLDTSKAPMVSKQLTLDELHLLEQNNVSIAAHTHTHPLLDKTTDQKLHSELNTCYSLLQKWKFPFHYVFAYPNGNNNPAVVNALKQAGYKFAFVFDHQVTNSISDRYQISRLSVNDYTPLWKYKFILSGLHSKILTLRKKWKI